jgi:hypothetical protein
LLIVQIFNRFQDQFLSTASFPKHLHGFFDGSDFAPIHEMIALSALTPIGMTELRKLKMSFRIAAIVVMGITLFSSQQVLAQGQPLIALGQCAGGYFPVCAVKKRILVTYVNSCAARSAGARVISDHACQEGCPRQYVPVCAKDAAGRHFTFGNACEAERAGTTIVRQRGCRGLLGRR